jgi:hypothetical protein
MDELAMQIGQQQHTNATGGDTHLCLRISRITIHVLFAEKFQWSAYICPEEDVQKIGEETRLIPLYLKHDFPTFKTVQISSTGFKERYRRNIGVGIAQLVLRRATGLVDPGSIPGMAIFLLFSKPSKTNCGAHPTSYPMGTKGDFPGGNAEGSVKLTTPI